jgi:ABC-type transport system involved in multi-copper enzyme maturation permease subunit
VSELAGGAGVIARMTMTRLRRGRLLWVCLALLALPVAGAAVLAAGGNGLRDLYDNLLEIYFYFLVPFVPALLASPSVAEEVEARTVTFLFARPAPRAALVLGKYLAVVASVGAAVALSLAAAWLISMLPAPSEIPENLAHLARTELAALLGVAAFGALACAASALFSRHPFAAVVIYLVVVEAGLGTAPLMVNLLAISWHLRNLAELPRPESMFFAVAVAPWESALLAAGAAALLLAVASLVVRHAEY